MYKSQTHGTLVFRPYINDLRNTKGYARKTEIAAYVPGTSDVIVKITEDEFASVFIEKNTLRSILIDEASYLVGPSRDYLLFIDAGLEEGNKIDWFSGLFMKGGNKEIYYELIKDEIVKEVIEMATEMHFKKTIESVKDLLLDRAISNCKIIVYDKEQKEFLNYLQVHGLRVVKTKLRYDSIIKVCLKNKHVIFTFNKEDD